MLSLLTSTNVNDRLKTKSMAFKTCLPFTANPFHTLPISFMTYTILALLWYICASFFFFESTAHAYGPVTHIYLGTQALGGLALLAPPLARILYEHSHAFLYGNVAADVIIAKNLADEERHCHNWSVGFGVLEEAQTDAQKAFAWGYLCHLAADVVAHNYFVPWKLATGFSARTTGHAYWEIRLDQKIPGDAWERVHQLSQEPLQEHHELLSRTIEGTLFKFETNLTLFNGMLFIQRLKRWKTLLDRVERRSKWTLSDQDTRELLYLSERAVMQLLTQGQDAPICQADPTGIPNLQVAKKIRKMLRKVRAHKRIPEDQNQDFLVQVRERFKRHATQPFSKERWPLEFVHPQQVLDELVQLT